MASHHKRERSPYFWISYTTSAGRQKWHNTQLRHEQESEAVEMCREFERQVARTKQSGSLLTVRDWAERWFKDRGSKIKSMKDDRSRIKKHVLPRIGSIELRQVRKADVQAVFDALRIAHDTTGKPASGTIKSIYAATKVMFNDAVAADIIPASPLFLTSQSLPSVRKKARLPYTIPEIEKILGAGAAEIPDDRKTLYAILFFFGLRFGEGAALRWSDFDRDMEPLAKMDVTKAWSNSRKETGETKTGTERRAPVHPVMFYLLEQWRDVGFPALFGREPTAADLIVPSREGRARSSNHGMKRLRQDLARSGIPHLELRTQHAFRTSFISQMRVADVDKDKVRAVTHGKRSSGDVIDAFYTVWPWETLCGAVQQIRFSETFLHSFYTAVSMRNDSEKWRGGRDSKPSNKRYLTLLAAHLQGAHARGAGLNAPSVNAEFTLVATEPTPDFTLVEMPEPLSFEEILRLLPEAHFKTPTHERYSGGEFYPSDWVQVMCEGCGRKVDTLDGGKRTPCPLCGGVLSWEHAVMVVE
jgi:integrase